MKVVIVMPSLKAGGAQRVIINIIKKMISLKYEVLLILICYKGDLFTSLPEKTRVMILGKKRVRYGIFKLFKIIKKENPDLVFSSLGHVNLILLFLKKFLSKKIKFIVREANTPSSIIDSNLILYLYKYLYISANKIVAQSDLIKNELISIVNIDERKISRINNPIDVQFIRKNIKNFRRPSTSKKLLISAGRLVFQKGFDRVIKILADYEEDFQYIILGEGPEFKNLSTIVTNLNLNKKIFFRGYVKNPWELIASSDVFLLPSRWEGTPNAALEALACGTRVIATPDSGGLNDLKEAVLENNIMISEVGDGFIKCIDQSTKELKSSLLESKLPLEFDANISTAKFINLFEKTGKLNF